MPDRVEPLPGRPDDLLVPEPSTTSGDANATDVPSARTEPNGLADPQAIIISRTVTIPNRRGLHARAAAKFVTLAERFDASVDVIRDGQSVSARSIMGLMMLGAGCGSTIELRGEGWGAKEALDALATLVESGFEEND
jgi:phosphocarrier protein HPr